MKRIYQDDFDILGGMDLSDSSILRHKDLFKRSIDTHTENVDEMFDQLKIRSEDGIYYLRYDCPWVPPSGESRRMYGCYFDYKFDEWCDLLQYLKVIYCIDFYHKDLSENLCDVIKNGTLDFRELNDDLIFMWASQNFHTNVLESLKNAPIFAS